MNRRWITLDPVSAGSSSIVARIHVADELGEFAFRCGHAHRREDTARRCAQERWPDVEVRG